MSQHMNRTVYEAIASGHSCMSMHSFELMRISRLRREIWSVKMPFESRCEARWYAFSNYRNDWFNCQVEERNDTGRGCVVVTGVGPSVTSHYAIKVNQRGNFYIAASSWKRAQSSSLLLIFIDRTSEIYIQVHLLIGSTSENGVICIHEPFPPNDRAHVVDGGEEVEPKSLKR